MSAQELKTTISLKVAPVTLQRLDELKGKWKDNRSQIIIRCIEDVWRAEMGYQKKLNGKSEEE